MSDTLAESLGTVQETYTQHETHEETADMREIVETREETEDKGDGDVEEEEEEVFDGRAAGLPVVEEVEEGEGEDAEEGA